MGLPLTTSWMRRPREPQSAARSSQRQILQIIACEERCIPSAASASLRTELVFVDPRVPDIRTLVADLSANSDSGRHFEVVVLSARRGGIDQITAIIGQYRDLDAVHFISHGNRSGLQLGSTWLDQATLASKAGQVAGWSAALKPGADLMFYGCDLAAGIEGRALLESIQGLTGADVAASSDATGAAVRGGNWRFEFQDGLIQTPNAFSAHLQATYGGTLTTFVVTSTADSGAGSLRDAIVQANAAAGADTITFNFALGGVHTISLASALPALTGPLTIDGTTAKGYANAPLIELDGSSAGNSAIGLDLASKASIRGLAIINFRSDGMRIQSNAGGSAVESCYFGCAADGFTAADNRGYGINISGAVDVAIGGVGVGNVVSANRAGGLLLTGTTTNATIAANLIGLAADGVTPLGNRSHGILVTGGATQNLVGGSAAGSGNTIAFNQGDGIAVTGGGATDGNRFYANSIHDNSGLGIDLDDDGVSVNDPGDPDSGANAVKNYPVINSAFVVSNRATIAGTYNSSANTSYRLEFYASSAADASGYGEGTRYLGTTTVTTNASGDATFSVNFAVPVAVGEFISATATDLAFNRTSEFSLAVEASGSAGVIVTPTAGLITTEASGQATFTVVLTSKVSGNVSIPLSVNRPSEAALSTIQLTFTTANWNIPQTVTITGLDDAIVDGDQLYTIILGVAASSDNNYDGLDAPDVDAANLDNDVAGITVTPTSGLTTTESGGQATFSVVLNSQPTGSVTIPLNVSNSGEGSLSVSQLVFTAANWNVAQTVTVTGVDDASADGNRNYTIILGTALSSDGNYAGLDAPDVDAANLDNDVAGITVTPTSGLTTTESGGQATFNLVLNSQPTGNVTIPLNVSNIGEGSLSVSELVFTAANWNVAQTVTVTGVDDTIADGNRNYTVMLGAASSSDGNYASLDASDVSAVNIDNDLAGITVTPTAGLTTTEAGGQATFNLVLNSQPSGNVTIPLNVSNIGEGSLSVSQMVFTAANWNVAQTVTVTGVDDAIADGNRNYAIILGAALSSDGNYAGLDASDISAVNLDNDVAGITVTPTSGLTTTESGGQATFNVVLNSQPTGNVTIPLNVSNIGEGSLSDSQLVFTAANWNVAQTVTVTGVDDASADGNRNYTIILGTALSSDGNYAGLDAPDVDAANLDNDVAGITVTPTSGLTTTESGGQATFNVVLNSQPFGNVTIPLNVSNIGEGSLSVNQLVFTAANWNVAQTVTVTGVDDAIADGNRNYTIILGTALSSDGNYAVLDASDISAVNLDNDVAGITVTPTSGLTTTESGGQATFNVVLNSQPIGNVTIPLNVSNIGEGSLSVNQLVFTAANWNVAQTVTVTGVDDAIADGNRNYTIMLGSASSSDGNYAALDASDISAVNLDNDVAGITVTPTSGLTTTESGGQASLSVVLNSQPTGNVTIPLNVSNIGEGSLSVNQLVFTAANWNVAQTVTVTGVDDAIADGNRNYAIIFGPALSSDASFVGQDASDVSVVNRDNDAVGVIVVRTGAVATTEAGGISSFSVVLTSQPTGNVTISLSSSNVGEGVVGSSALAFTPSNWQTPQVVTVRGVDDVTADGDRRYSIRTSLNSNDAKYSAVDPSDVDLINRDDDRAGLRVVAAPLLTTFESGNRASFTVALKSRPIANVTVFVHSSDYSRAYPSVADFVVTPDNWDRPFTITVTAVDDSIAGGDGVFLIGFGLTVSDDPNYRGLTSGDLLGRTLDDDVAGFRILKADGLTVDESGVTAEFRIVLLSQPIAPITLRLVSENPGEVEMLVTTLTFGPGDWSTPQSVGLRGVRDGRVDGDTTTAIASSVVNGDANYLGVSHMTSVLNRDVVASTNTAVLVSATGIGVGAASTDGQKLSQQAVFTTAGLSKSSTLVFTSDSGGGGGEGNEVVALAEAAVAKVVSRPIAFESERGAARFQPQRVANAYFAAPTGGVRSANRLPARPDALNEAFEKLDRELQDEQIHRASVARVSLGTAAIATAGYVLWSIRGATWLASAVASAAPTWKSFDLLTLLKKRRDDESDDDTLGELADGTTRA